jgi:hypothetical protein
MRISDYFDEIFGAFCARHGAVIGRAMTWFVIGLDQPTAVA